MIDRSTVITAVRTVLDRRAEQCREEHAAIGANVADELGLLKGAVAPAGGHDASSSSTSDASDLEERREPSDGAGGRVLQDLRDASSSAAHDTLPARGRVYVFGRRIAWLPIALASRFDGVIIATRTSRGNANRSPGWVEALRATDTEVIGWDWMLEPGAWRPGLVSHVSWLAAVGARALCLNIEPASGSKKGTAADWRGQHDELRAYVELARELCDQRGLELWGTGWALASGAPTFPWLEFLRPLHRTIPQPYEVHGREGDSYVAQVLAEWRERGARDIILGRGAHELDKRDDDAWRTPAEIAAHRASTPAGLDEAWWCPAGTPPPNVVDAILA